MFSHSDMKWYAFDEDTDMPEVGLCQAWPFTSPTAEPEIDVQVTVTQ